MSQSQRNTKTVGQHMLKLLSDKEQGLAAGGQKGTVRPPGPNGCSYVRGSKNPCKT